MEVWVIGTRQQIFNPHFEGFWHDDSIEVCFEELGEGRLKEDLLFLKVDVVSSDLVHDEFIPNSHLLTSLFF